MTDPVASSPAAATLDPGRSVPATTTAATSAAAAAPLASRSTPGRPARIAGRPSRHGSPAAVLDRHLLVGVTLLLVSFGLVMVLSASSVTAYSAYGSSFTFLKRQGLWAAIGLGGLLVASRLSVRTVRRLAYPVLLLAVAGLLLVLVPGVGSAAYGATRWVSLGAVQVQPSEPVKLGVVRWGADLLARKEALLGQTKHLLVPLVPVCLVIAGLILAEPDMGTMMVVTSILLMLLLIAGARRPTMLVMLAGIGAAGALMALAAPYRVARLTSFVDPFAHSSGSGYQAVQGLYAVASGGWYGLGLGASRQKWSYLPNSYTDYIFAIIGEELGFIGCAAVLALFATLAYTGLRIASRSADPFLRLITATVTVWLVGQAVINIGYVVGLLPVTGVTLPLVSSGGTSTAVTMFVFGLLANAARHEPQAIAALRTGGEGRFAKLLGLPAPVPFVARPAMRVVRTGDQSVQRGPERRRPTARGQVREPVRGPRTRSPEQSRRRVTSRGAERRRGGRR